MESVDGTPILTFPLRGEGINGLSASWEGWTHWTVSEER